MRKNAPHLVQDLSFVIPSYDWWNSPFYGIGLKVYDMMAGNLGLGPSTLLDREETIELIPNVKKKGLRGVLYTMTVNLMMHVWPLALLKQQKIKASLLNYFGVKALLKEDNMVAGVLAKDELSGEEIEISAKVVINATGVFSDEILQMDQPEAENSLCQVKEYILF